MKKTIVVMAFIFALGASGCSSKAGTGAGAGALAGGLVGALTSKNKISGAAIGAGVGLMLGYVIGNEMDKHDQEQISDTLDHGRTGVPHTWVNPDSGKEYTATPERPYRDGETVCRDIVIAKHGGQPVLAKAYRDENGEWRIKQ